MNIQAAASATNRSRDDWDRIADAFDRFTTPFTLQLGDHVLDRVRVEAGMHLLDVAAGSGAIALPAARRGAHVLAVDIAPVMIERLAERARAAGLTHVDARVMDGLDLDIVSDRFDIVASQNGVSLFPDVKRGLREMVRVARPGGRVAVAAFGPPRAVEFVALFMAALEASVPGFPGLPTDPPPLPFQLSDPDRLRRELIDAGLSDVRVEQADWPMEFRSAAHYRDAIIASNPIAAALVADLSAAHTRDLAIVLDNMFRERFQGGPAILHNAVNVGLGTK